MERRCKDCGQIISAGRLEALPATETCVACSDETPILETEPGVVDGADKFDLIRMATTPSGELR